MPSSARVLALQLLSRPTSSLTRRVAMASGKHDGRTHLEVGCSNCNPLREQGERSCKWLSMPSIARVLIFQLLNGPTSSLMRRVAMEFVRCDGRMHL
ncbi:hypothetical protein Q31a_44870 [Aureliella helgolandensis]|uniref:Uncharacterized protein n=1 Tax=Aureliella helgolandensis TaxID=2527968 RepID=A0A518GBZ8_9BACT|nr:hypothetical protein Q31a_44870 [Aureliella helgolandensis]